MSSLQKELVKSRSGGGSGKKNRSKKNVQTTTPMMAPKSFTPTITTVYSSTSDDDDDDDDGGSSSSSSSSSDDDSSIDTNEGQQRQHQQQQHDSEDMIKIRQQAFDLLNTPSVGPNASAAKKKNGKPFVSPYQQQQQQQQQQYQQQSTGERSTGRSPYSSSTNTTTASSAAASSASASYQSSSPYAMHNPHDAHPQARTAEELSMTDMFVNCVSDVCKSSSSEIFQKVLGAGYKSVSTYGDQPVKGTWGDSIDTSQHGYGNSNHRSSSTGSNFDFARGGGGNMPTRYQD